MQYTLVGILNVTPDSFYDGGKFNNIEDAINHGFRLIQEGAHVIDVGGESTRPGAEFVSIEDECARVIDVVQALAPHIAVSIDTSKPIVAHKAREAGASILNDVQGLQHPAMMDISTDFEEVVIMHSRGTPQTMHRHTTYNNILDEIWDFFARQISLCSCPQIWLDVGIGFAKTPAQNLTLLNNIAHFHSLNHPVYIGASRKSFIPKTLHLPMEADRLGGSLATVASTYKQGAKAFRVHDIAHTKQLLDMLNAIEDSQ